MLGKKVDVGGNSSCSSSSIEGFRWDRDFFRRSIVEVWIWGIEGFYWGRK